MSFVFDSETLGRLEKINRAQVKNNRGIFLDVKPAYDPPPAYGNQFDEDRMSIDEDKIYKDAVYDSSTPIYNVLRVMGVFPITRTNGKTKFSWGSPTMIYSLIVFAGIMTYIAFIGVERMKIIKSLEGRFEEAVIAYLFVVNILPVVIVPLMWLECKKIARVLDDWTDFEIVYYKTALKPLVLNLKSKALLVSILLPLLSCVSVIITHVTMIHFKFEQAYIFQIIPYCYLDTLTYLLGGFWYMACETLSKAANVLADDFQKALRHIGPAALVSEYRALWLRLSKITRNTGLACGYTFTFINLYLFLIITLSIYGLMSQISAGFGAKDIGLAITAICSTCLLFFICNEAHYASFNVRTNFQKKLLMVELSWMSFDAQTEINMFLRATEMEQSNINLSGFFDVNRTLFKSLLATMVTYLVVLLQFQISLPEDPNMMFGNGTKSTNSTNSSQI